MRKVLGANHDIMVDWAGHRVTSLTIVILMKWTKNIRQLDPFGVKYRAWRVLKCPRLWRDVLQKNRPAAPVFQKFARSV